MMPRLSPKVIDQAVACTLLLTATCLGQAAAPEPGGYPGEQGDEAVGTSGATVDMSLSNESGGTPAYLFEGPVLTADRAKRSFEAEGLLAAGLVRSSANEPTGQDMGGFGAGWSGNSQLFWPAEEVGARLDVSVPVLVEGRYSIDVYMTQAPDYGKVGFEVEGDTVPVEFDGYAPRVEPADAVRLGVMALPMGQRSVTFHITGRNADSSAYFVGIDRIVLVQLRAVP